MIRSLFGEMAELVEGAPLLREYGAKSFIEGSNPSLSAITVLTCSSLFGSNAKPIVSHVNAPVAQLDRVPGYELGGREFESLRARQTLSSVIIFSLYTAGFSRDLVLLIIWLFALSQLFLNKVSAGLCEPWAQTLFAASINLCNSAAE